MTKHLKQIDPTLALGVLVVVMGLSFVWGRSTNDRIIFVHDRPKEAVAFVPPHFHDDGEGVEINARQVNAEKIRTWEVTLLGKDGSPAVQVKAGENGKPDFRDIRPGPLPADVPVNKDAGVIR